MVFIRTPFFGLLFVFLVNTLGCTDDPSGIGLALVDAQAGEPFVVTLEADRFQRRSEADVTGGFIGLDANLATVRIGARRILAGLTDDPALGQIVAQGHVDFTALQSASDAFRNGTVSGTSLTFALEYVYGDTLTPVVYQLKEIVNDWSARDARADTSLSIGNEITQFTVHPRDANVVVELPQAWLTANDAMLRSTTLAEEFHGFQLSQISGNSVIGFSAASTEMKIKVPGDSLTLSADRIVSTISKNALDPSPEYVLVQDGFGSLDLVVDFNDDQITDSAIHNAIFRLTIPTVELATPTGYVRPRISEINLVAITGTEESRTPLGSGFVGDNETVSFQGTDVNTAIQNVVRGVGDLVRFQIEVPVATTTLDILFFGKEPLVDGPRVVLTVTEVNV